MDMSKAALAPNLPAVTKEDKQHILYPIYSQYREMTIRQMLDCSSFRDWLRQYEQSLRDDEARDHPEWPAFKAWMDETKGGARRCPVGIFPNNFYYWINGGRW